MLNVSMASNSNTDDSEELLFSKRLRGRVRLPPLSGTVSVGSHDSFHKTAAEGGEKVPGLLTNNVPSSGTKNLLAPKMYKNPTSPSNLSIQFNFDETLSSDTTQLVGASTRDVRPKLTSNGHKLLQRSKTNASSGKVKSNKGYRILQNEDHKIGVSPGDTQTVADDYCQKFACPSNVNSSSSPRRKKTRGKNEGSVKASIPRTNLGAGLNRNDRSRKSSTYDLREFLSLPTETCRGNISTSVNKKNIPKTPGQEKQPERLTKSSPSASQHSKLSESNTYNIFEFLALSTDADRPSTGCKTKMNKKLKELKGHQVAKVKTVKFGKKPEIPSIVVADWSLKKTSPRTEQSSRKNCELPKTNFPGDNFPHCKDVLVTPSETARRTSLYDLKEFLTLPTRSVSLSKDSTPEERRDSKYNLLEFLTFFETRASANSDCGSETEVSLARPHTSALVETNSFRDRTLSVYDIYEFLKATKSATNAQDCEQTFDKCHGKDGKRNPSIIDLTEFFDRSSPNNDRSVQGALKSADQLRRNPQGSCYDLREFLSLPVSGEKRKTTRKTKSGLNRHGLMKAK